MAAAAQRGAERQLTRTRSRMLEKLEKKRSAGQGSLQQRISKALSSSASPTPAGGSPAGGSPTAAGLDGGVAAAWSQGAGTACTSPAGSSPAGGSPATNGSLAEAAKANGAAAAFEASAAAQQPEQQPEHRSAQGS